MADRVIRSLGVSLLALAAVSLGAAQPTAADDTPDERQARKKLVGVWKGYVVDGKGEKADRGPVKLELTITETTIRGVEIKQGDQAKTVDHGMGDFTIDLTADPKNLDAVQIRPNGQKAAHLGIYSLDGDTLKWCVTKGKTRPTQFKTGPGMFLLILKREPEKK